MGRDRAVIQTRIWADDDFTALTADAQLLYLQVLADVDFCGVAPYTPGRYAQLSADATPDDVKAAAGELEDGRFVMVDEARELILVRTFVRNDGVLASPNLLKRMAADFEKLRSPLLKRAFLWEWHRSCRPRLDMDRLGKVSGAREAVTGLPEAPPDDPWGNPSGNPSPNPSGNPSPPGGDSAAGTLPENPSGNPSTHARSPSPPHPELHPTPPRRARQAASDHPEPAPHTNRQGGGDTKPEPPTPPGSDTDERARTLLDAIIADLPGHHANTIRLGAPRVSLHALLVEAVHGGWHTGEVTGAVTPGWPDNAKAPAELLAARIRKRVLARTSPTAKARTRELEQQRDDEAKAAARAEDAAERDRLDRILDELDPANQERLAKAAAEQMPHPADPDLTRPSLRALARRILAAELQEAS